MRSLDSDLRRFGGIVRRSRLLVLGYTKRQLTAAVSTGRLTVPRRGWVASQFADADAVRAVALGGRVGGASALRAYRIWVDRPGPLVIASESGASRLPEPQRGETRIWSTDRFPEVSDHDAIVSVRDAILQHARECGRSELIAVIDSALYTRRLRPDQLPALLEALPRRVRPSSREIDGTAMSGTESHMRVCLRSAGYRVEIQVDIAGVGIVDLLVDGWYIIECDSAEHHGSAEQQQIDRRRDGAALLLGYGESRFAYEQVMHQREWCLAFVAAGLAAGRPAAD